MTSKPLFREARIAEVSAAIVDALRPHVSSTYGSTSDEAAAKTAAFKAGLNNGETRLAIARALSILEQEVLKDFAALLYDRDEDDDDYVIGVADIAEALSEPHQQVEYWLENGTLPAVKFENTWMVLLSDIQSFLDRGHA